MTNRTPFPVVVEVPPEARHVHVLRSVVASVASRLDISLDSIEDLKIAVDEACAHLLSAGGTRLRMEVLVWPTGIEITTSTDGGDSQWPPEGFEGSLTWQVLTALTDDASFARENGPVLRFTKRTLLAHG